ncbi:hypothetical protein ES703_57206 [subsurface metagenome]
MKRGEEAEIAYGETKMRSIKVAHVTHKGNIPSILEKGLECKDFSVKHPIGKTCTTFFYPLDGIDDQLKYRPINARMSGEELDDESYVIVDVSEEKCFVGDLRLEGKPEIYRKHTIPLKEYAFKRGMFEEPEVVCFTSIEASKVKRIIPYSEMKKIFGACKGELRCLEKKVG